MLEPHRVGRRGAVQAHQSYIREGSGGGTRQVARLAVELRQTADTATAELRSFEMPRGCGAVRLSHAPPGTYKPA